MRTAGASEPEVKKVRRRGGRINAKIDADLEIKPKRTTVKTKKASAKSSTAPKRKRTTELEEEDDGVGTARKYQGAEGAFDDAPIEAKPKPKKPEAYVENCSGPSQPKRRKISSLERYFTQNPSQVGRRRSPSLIERVLTHQNADFLFIQGGWQTVPWGRTSSKRICARKPTHAVSRN